MSDAKVMRLRYAGQCQCGAEIAKGQEAVWDRNDRKVICLPCYEHLSVNDHELITEPGVPGGSLLREYERRMAKREARVVGRFPRVGRILLKVFEPAHTTKAFATGAKGEREVAGLMEVKLGGDALFLYNRRRGRGSEKGDIDILVVVPSGVFIIDPKKYAGRKVRSDRSGDTFVIDGRRRIHLAPSMRRQIEVVTEAMSSSPYSTVPVCAAYCFVGADLPWTKLKIDGVAVLGKKGVIKMLKRAGTLDPEQRRAIHAYLHQQFPPA